MPRIVAVEPALAPHRHTQGEITEAVARLVSGADERLLRRVHASAGVGSRHLALPLAEYARLDSFGAANDAFIEVGAQLAQQALTGALGRTGGVGPGDVDLVVSTTVTGLAVPSLEARIAGPVGLPETVRRVPLFGLGCVAGAAGIARVHDHLVGHPGHVGALLSVELCSLTVQRADPSPANLVASGLFADGAAAVVMVGDDRAGDIAASAARGLALETVATRSRLYPGTQRAMGWDVRDTGLGIVLGVEVPELVRGSIRGDVETFLAGAGLSLGDIGFWVAHPGGPKVLQALEEALDLHGGELDVTWESLRRVGNMSSASVLHVLADTLAGRARPAPEPGQWGVILAMGPGFCLETVLVRAV